MDWQYIAGFFDGEGSITHNGQGYRISIPQSHQPVLDAIRAYSHVGKVFSLTKRQRHWKDAWVYAIARQKDVLFFLQHIRPFIIVKRKSVDQVLQKLPSIVNLQGQRATLAAWRRSEAIRLRQKGLSYRAIGKQIGIDWGYVRRLTLPIRK